mgnify:CR=1 FL=1
MNYFAKPFFVVFDCLTVDFDVTGLQGSFLSAQVPFLNKRADYALL